MTSTANRIPYIFLTPETTTFDPDIPLARLGDFGVPPRRSDDLADSSSQHDGLRAKWNKFASKCKATYESNTGLLLIAISGAFMSIMSTLVKKLNSMDPPVPMLELIFVRMSITGICCMLYMWLTNIPDPLLGPKRVRWLLVLRGISGFMGISGLYFSLQYLSVSDATVLQFLTPVCTGVASALFLQEHFTRDQALASLFSLVGVVLIARPTFLFGEAADNPEPVPDLPAVRDDRSDYAEVTPAQRLTAVGFAMFGVLGGTVAYTTIRAIGKRAHALHSVVAYTVQSTIVSIILMLALRTSLVLPTRLDWVLMLLAIGFCGLIYQVLFAMGLQIETAGRGTMAVYVQIVFSTMNDYVFFHSTPNFLSVVGTAVIISSAIYVAMSKKDPQPHQAQQPSITRPEDHSLEEGLLEHQDEVVEASSSERKDHTTTPDTRTSLAHESAQNAGDRNSHSETRTGRLSSGLQQTVDR